MAGLDKPACVCFGKADVCMSTGSSGFKGTHPGANPNSLKSELWLLPPRAGLEKSLSYTQTPPPMSWVEEATGAKAGAAEQGKQIETPARLMGLANT